jgi:hypothetical protein
VSGDLERDLRRGLAALLGYGMEDLPRLIDEHQEMYGEPHEAQAWVDALHHPDTRIMVAGESINGHQALAWAAEDGSEVLVEFVWRTIPPEVSEETG